MTRATTTIPFSTIKFIDKIPRLSDLTERLTHKLRQIRLELNRRDPHRMADGTPQSSHALITNAAKVRNNTLRATRYYGRAFWKRWTGYHARSRIEARMRCLKAFGERIAVRDPDRQTTEIHIRIALMNRFSALGTAEIVRVA